MRQRSFARPTIAVALVLGLLASMPRPASAQEDPWLGTDKALQFGIGFGVAAIGYGVGRVTFEARLESALFGFGISVAATGIKELLDYTANTGTPSWRDLAWGVVGAGLGVIVGWLIDLAIGGDEPAAPHEPFEPRALEEPVPLLPAHR